MADLRCEYRLKRIIGFCIDIGVPESAAGRKERNRILNDMGSHLTNLRPSLRRFCFGDQKFKSWNNIYSISTPRGITQIIVHFDIVQADVPTLLCVDILNREKLVLDTFSIYLLEVEPLRKKIADKYTSASCNFLL